ncbi:LysR family transcriptional regulator [Caballeronia sp. dw_276]|jgi:DNA-binding transcriptional LysR family regulator|uniref:LysR family transcriptional regulator n=1 Tax=Caballeronia sp. dw_276 TaxID=2719795 RepID=UPI001BD607DF|nr:LysR family transcriptional regulator [Caballeronia sp. dw_276]
MKNLRQFMSFAAVARNSSFAAAARELGLAPSSVAKSVARLESELGVRLFHRTTRAVRLTAEGDALFARCARVLEEIDSLELSAARLPEAPSGTLRVGAPIGYGTRKIVPVINRLLSAYPQLNVDIRLTDERVNLVTEGLDAVVRIGALDDSGLVARRIDQQHLVLCASPGYLSANGTPKSVAEVEQRPVILFRMPTNGRERPLEFVVDGRAIQLRPRSRFALSHGDAMVEAVLDGAGIAQVPEHMAERHLRNGTLVELLPECRPAPLPVNVITPGARMMPPRVRVFIDALISRGLGSG